MSFWSRTASRIWRSLTLLHEQTWASPVVAARGATRPPTAAQPGGTVSGLPLLNSPSNVPNSEASPTRTPPSRRVPSGLKTSFL